MKLSLKWLDIAGDDLNDHCPDNPCFFSLGITATIGSEQGNDICLYNIHVCSPDWVKYAMKYTLGEESIWGRHMLIVNEFCQKKIELAIENKIEEVVLLFPDDTSTELYEKIARYAHWEFEDYIQE